MWKTHVFFLGIALCFFFLGVVLALACKYWLAAGSMFFAEFAVYQWYSWQCDMRAK